MWIAIPVLLLALYDIGYICFVFFTGSHYSYSQNFSPFHKTGIMSATVYTWLTYCVISIDTYLVARELQQQKASQ